MYFKLNECNKVRWNLKDTKNNTTPRVLDENIIRIKSPNVFFFVLAPKHFVEASSISLQEHISMHSGQMNNKFWQHFSVVNGLTDPKTSSVVSVYPIQNQSFSLGQSIIRMGNRLPETPGNHREFRWKRKLLWSHLQ